jgi:hypothetical protein
MTEHTIETLPTASRPYAAPILAVGKETLSVIETMVIAALDADRIERRHVTFASHCRRAAAGEDASSIDAYLGPAREAGELHVAMAAVHWLQAQGAAQRGDNGVRR